MWKNLTHFFATFLLVRFKIFASLRFLLTVCYRFFFRFEFFASLPFRFEFFVSLQSICDARRLQYQRLEYSIKKKRTGTTALLIISAVAGVLMLLTPLLFLVFPPLLAFMLLLLLFCSWCFHSCLCRFCCDMAYVPAIFIIHADMWCSTVANALLLLTSLLFLVFPPLLVSLLLLVILLWLASLLFLAFMTLCCVRLLSAVVDIPFVPGDSNIIGVPSAVDIPIGIPSVFSTNAVFAFWCCWVPAVVDVHSVRGVFTC